MAVGGDAACGRRRAAAAAAWRGCATRPIQPDAGDLRERDGSADAQLSSRTRATAACRSEQLRPAHYALCASLDDVVLNTPWGSSGDWGAALAGLDLPSGGAQRRALLRSAHADARRTRAGSCRSRADVPLHVARLHGPLSPVARAAPASIDRIREETYAVIVRQQKPAEPALVAALARASTRPTGRRASSCRSGSPPPPGWASSAALFLWFSIGLNAASDDLSTPACRRRRRAACRRSSRAPVVEPRSRRRRPPPPPEPRRSTSCASS